MPTESRLVQMGKFAFLAMALIVLWGCGTDTSQLDQLAGTYRMVKITVNGKDTLAQVQGYPFPLGANEIVLTPNRYKGKLFARFQGPVDSLSFAIYGEYYLSDRSYQRTDLNNSLKAHSIIIGVDAVHQVGGAFPSLGPTLRVDTVARDANYNNLLPNGIWRIVSPSQMIGSNLIIERRGLNADSNNFYQMVWEKTAMVQ